MTKLTREHKIAIWGILVALFAAIGVWIGAFNGHKQELPRSSNTSAKGKKIDLPKAVSTRPSASHEGLNKLSNVPVGLTEEEVFKTLRDDSLTELQRAQFMRRTKGTIVQWSGSVRDVNRESWVKGTNIIMVVFVPDFGSGETLPPTVWAKFSSSEEADLSALRIGDEVTIQGKLDYMDLTPPSPILDDPMLIAFSKKKQ